MSILSVPTFCVVTGASRGIGRAFAIELSEKVGANSSFCLIARNQQTLEETAHTIREKVGEKVSVRCIATDLSDGESVTKLNRSIYGAIDDVSSFDTAMIVHNAGSLGDMTKYAREMNDIKFIQQYNMLKMSGPIVMTSEFLKTFGKPGSNIRKTVVQITSQGGTMPFKTAHVYCMAKAGRDMFFKVLALEEPKVRVLSFDPGYVDTDMFKDMYSSADEGLRGIADHMKKQPIFVQPKQAAKNLIQAIEDDKYDSGVVVV